MSLFTSLCDLPRLITSITGKLLHLALRSLLWATLILIWVWGILAIGVYEPWAMWFRLAVAVLWAVFFPAAAVLIPRRVKPPEFTLIIMAVTLLAGFVAIRVLWSFWHPTNEGNWSPLHAHLATATFHGDTVTVENVRDFTHHSRTEYDQHWETRSYDIRELTGVDMCICPFTWEGGGLAHTFLTFGFSNGERIAISVEARLEENQGYNFILGLFREYGLIYIVGDERDILGLRTNGRGDPLYLYPLDVEPPVAQAIFVMMMTRANRLDRRPEFYNTMTNCCASNMVRHIVQAYQGDYPFDLRVLLPGYLDDFAAENGALRIDGPLDEVREQYLVNDRDLQMTDSISWSRQIRGESAAQ